MELLRTERSTTNATLVAMVHEAARIAAGRVRWDDALNRQHAAHIAHTFCREHIRYIEERDEQTIRLPSALVRDGVGDCKSTAVFIASFCHAAGHRVLLRFVNAPGSEQYGHVYAVVDGLAVDPLLPFGKECIYLQPPLDVEL